MLRVAFFILAFLLILGPAFVAPLLVLQADGEVPIIAALITLPVVTLSLPSVVLGSRWQYWPGEVWHGDGSRAFRREFIITCAIQLAAAAIFVWVAAAFGIPAWLPPTLIFAVAVGTVLIYVTSERLRRSESLRADKEIRATESTIVDGRRLSRNIILGAAVGVTLGLAVSFALVTLTDEAPGSIEVGPLAGFTLVFGLLGAALPVFPVTFRTGRALRAVTSSSWALTRKLQRRVLRGKEVELTDDELRTADLYADRVNPALRMQSLLFALVFGAQIPLQLSQVISSTEIRWLSVFAIAAFIALFGVLAIVYPRYFRNIKRFQTERAAQQATESSTPGT